MTKKLCATEVAHCFDVNEKIETRDGSDIFKFRRLQAENIEKIFGTGQKGRLSINRWRAEKQWNGYEETSNVDFANSAVPLAFYVHGPDQRITLTETEAALKKTNSNKATVSGELPSESWCVADN